MPRNGAGTYTAPASTWNPGVNGVTATTADFNAQLTDISAAITQSVSRDGQSPMTGNLPMGNNKITGLAPGTANTDGAQFAQTVGRIITIQYISATVVPTYNAATTKLLVYACGGGGGGGGCPVAGGAFASAAGGGGSATWGMKLITSGFAGLTATIGAPGTATAGAAGGNGGTTSLGGLLVCPGGNGGGSATPGTSGISGGGGVLSGNATGADYFFRGQAGAHGIVLSALSAFSGQGGSNPLGSGGGSSFTNIIAAVAGLAGQGAGSGGSGAAAAQNGVTVAGGAGGNGYMMIFELS